jgi:hypothetical protein
MAKSRKQLEDQVNRLERRLNSVILLVSIQRQAFQRFCLEEAFTCTVGNKARVGLDGISQDVFTQPARSFPIPSLETMLDNTIHSVLYNG